MKFNPDFLDIKKQIGYSKYRKNNFRIVLGPKTQSPRSTEAIVT